MPQVRKINLKIWAVVIAVLLCCPYFLYALPEGESVIEGNVSFDRSQANTLKINVTSDKAIIDYNNFSIATNESVYFSQLSVSSAALNRVTGSSLSDILGSLSANGIIYLINPNGINIGPTANIDAAGIIASTLNISNLDFLAGRNNFFKDGENTFIINQGNIIVRNGGYVALLSQAVENRGVIQANLGSVALAAGEKMTLALDDLNQISVVIDEGVKEAVFGPDGNRITSAVKNSGTITANGGKVILTAKVLNNVFDYAVNNTGIVEAKSLESHNGVIELKGEGAAIVNTGTLNAGVVNVEVKDAAFINKGKVIAPKEPTIETSGIINIQVNSLLQGGSIIADKLISVTVDTIDVFITDNPNAIEVDPLLNTSPAVIISAPEVKVIARQFGSSDAPVNIDAPLTYIYRTSGDINILESLGIGTSILLRGPPDGFGAIVYNRNTNLTLEANQVNLIGSAPTYLYGNIIFSNFTCTVPAKEIYFEAGKTYAILGEFKIQGAYAQHVKLLSSEQGRQWFIDPQGLRDISYAWIEDSYNFNPDEIIVIEGTNRGNSPGWDPTAIWIGIKDGLWSDSASWSWIGGGVTPGAGDDVVFNDISTNVDSIVDADFSGTIGSLTIDSGYTKIITLNRSLITTTSSGRSGNITINSGTLTLGTNTLTVAGNLTVNAGTFNAGSGTVTFTGAASQIGASNFNNLTIDVGSDNTATLTGDITVNGDLTVSSGILDPGVNTVTGTGTLTVCTGATIRIFTNGEQYLWDALTVFESDSTVEYTGGDQPIDEGIPYQNLTLSGSGIKTLGGAITVDGDLTVNSGVTLDVSGSNYGITVGGNWDNNGSFTAGTGTVYFNGTTTVSGSSATTFNHVTINSGCVLTGHAVNMYVSGNWLNDGGAFEPNGGTVTFNGTGTITSGAGNSFNNLDISGDYTQSGDLNIEGDYTQTAGSFDSDPVNLFSVAKSFSISGGTFTRYDGTGSSEDPYIIYDVYGLQGMIGGLDQSYQLNDNISASATSLWNPDGSGGYNGFVPIGDDSSSFSGTFNGASHTISDLYINRPYSDYVGLFGYVSSVLTVENVGLTSVNITGGNDVGALVGYNIGTVSNSYSTGTVTGSGDSAYDIGGLVGHNSGTISDSYSTCSVSAEGSDAYYIGGLAGYNDNSISSSYSTGTVTTPGNYASSIGGLVGYNYGFISDSYSTGAVTASGTEAYDIGGFIGYNDWDTIIENCYSTGTVSAEGSDAYDIGGFMGYNDGSVSNSYSTGTVTASGINASDIGGFIGYDDSDSLISNCAWYTGAYSGAIGYESYLGSAVYRLADEDYGYDEDSAESFYSPVHPVYDGWDFPDTWYAYSDTYPHLYFENYGTPITIYKWLGNTPSWTDPGNWSTGNVPDSESIVIIPNVFEMPTLDDTASIGSIRIEQGMSFLADGYPITVSGDWVNLGDFSANSGTVTFNGSGDQHIRSNGAYFDYLAIDKPSGKCVLDDALYVNNDLTIASSTSTLDLAGKDLEVYGNFINNGTLRLIGTESLYFDAGNDTAEGIAEYYGDDSYDYLAAGYGYYDLKFTGAGTYALADDLTINHNLDISSDSTLKAYNAGLDTSYNITVSGNWTNNGTFTAGTGTVTFNGGGISLLNSGVSAFNTISIEGSTTLRIKNNDLTAANINVILGKLGMEQNDRNLTVTDTLTILDGQTYTTGTGDQVIATLDNSGIVDCEGAGADGYNLQITNFINNAGSVFKYTKESGSVIVREGTYRALKLKGIVGDVTYSLQGTTTVTGSLTNTGGTLDIGIYTLNVSRNVTNDDTITISTGTLDVDGWFDVGTLTCSDASIIKVAGNWSGVDAFTADSSTVTFDGADAQLVTSGGSAFNILTITNNSVSGVTFEDTLTTDILNAASGVKKISFAADPGITHTITTTFNINGSAGNLIELAPNIPDTEWNLNAPTSTVTYVNVNYSHEAEGKTITARYSEGTNNTNWTVTGAPAKINVETAADGSGGIVGVQDLEAGSSITVYSIARDSDDNFIENIAADSWSLTNITGGVVSGDLAAAADNKSATLTGNKVGTAKIEATSGALTKNSSGTITVIPGPAATLVFVQQPTNANAGATITPSPTVEVRDALDNIRYDDSVTLSIGTNAGGGSLSGTLTKAVVGGVATFDGLSIDKAGSGYTLKASLAGATDAISNAFNIISTATDPKIDSQIANVIIGTSVLPDLGQPGFSQINSFNPGPVFLYTPLTPADIALFSTIAGAGVPLPGAGIEE